MNILTILAVMIVMAVLCLLATAVAKMVRGKINHTPLVGLANIAEGTREGGLTKYADAAQTLRFALVKVGTDGDHVAVAGASDTPYGVCTDEAAAAEDIVNVVPLACANGTVKVVNDATGAIAVGDLLVPAASGKVKKIAAGAGNYYVVGMAMQTASADGDVMEIIPIGAWKTQ